MKQVADPMTIPAYRHPVNIMFRNMVTDPPKKNGRYCVGHRGLVFSNAYYFVEDYYRTVHDGTEYCVWKKGWDQLKGGAPEWWIDFGDAELPTGGPCLPTPPVRKPSPIPVPVKLTFRQKIRNFFGF